MELDLFYLSALLHDIGKFVERGKRYRNIEDYSGLDTGWAHPKYSAWWLKNVRDKIPFFRNLSFSDDEWRELEDLVLWHHRPKTFWQKVLQVSDWLSSGERRPEEEEASRGRYTEEPLLSIFSEIYSSEVKEKCYYPLAKLSLDEEVIFPRNKDEVSVDYAKLEGEFEKELGKIESEADLLWLLRDFLWAVPAQVEKAKPDISLYDHLRTTSAIAVCYWHEIQKEGESSWEKKLKEIKAYLAGEGSKRDIMEEKDFLLVGGDLSGIQSFIFDVPSKGAAKSLKGRSLFLWLLMEVVARYIVGELNLKETNILYIGGGLFWILAPFSAESKLCDIRRKVSRIILEALKGQIYIALEWEPLTYKHFKEDFYSAVEWLFKRLSDKKAERFKEVLENEDGYELLFGKPLGLAPYEEHCVVCGENEKEKLLPYEESGSICSMCESFIDLSKKGKDKAFISLKEGTFTVGSITNCISLFKSLGFNIAFYEDRPKGEKTYLYYPSLKKPGETFENLVEKCEGDKLLCFLKLDLDNLGKLFREGLGKSGEKEQNYTISRVAALSRMLSLFFERYLPEEVISEEDYLVFAGGDDAFIVSPWNRALGLLEDIEKKFRKFVGDNPKITFSCGIFLAKHNFPVKRASARVEDELHHAKSDRKECEPEAQKNKVSIFGEALTKGEFEAVLRLWRKYKLAFGGNGGKARGTLFRLIRLAKELERPDGSSRFKFPKPWLVAYLLRDMDDRDLAKEMVDLYEGFAFRPEVNIEGETVRVRNPRLLYVALLLAYLSTREV